MRTMNRPVPRKVQLFGLLCLLVVAGASMAGAQVILTTSNGIVWNSLCVGFDCVSGVSFSDSTILLTENNTRIKFDDTSTAASFPRNDWELQANSSLNGGPNRFSINDCGQSSQGGCADTPVFAVEAGAGSNALYVDDGGRLGLGTSTPSTEIHSVDGDTPTLRLQQDGSSGFAPQTWDVAGNETNFFVRDVTNGSTLPLRIRPGAPSNSVFIDVDGDVGIGTASPGSISDASSSHASLHVFRSDGDASLLIEEGSTTVEQRALLELRNQGDIFFRLNNANLAQFVDINLVGDEFRINFANGGAGPELRLDNNGNLFLSGECDDLSGAGSCADYVFAPDYELLPIEELETFYTLNRHLPNVPSAEEMRANGVNVRSFQGRLLEKIEELTLYTVQQERKIAALENRLEALERARE